MFRSLRKRPVFPGCPADFANQAQAFDSERLHATFPVSPYRHEILAENNMLLEPIRKRAGFAEEGYAENAKVRFSVYIIR